MDRWMEKETLRSGKRIYTLLSAYLIYIHRHFVAYLEPWWWRRCRQPTADDADDAKTAAALCAKKMMMMHIKEAGGAAVFWLGGCKDWLQSLRGAFGVKFERRMKKKIEVSWTSNQKYVYPSYRVCGIWLKHSRRVLFSSRLYTFVAQGVGYPSATSIFALETITNGVEHIHIYPQTVSSSLIFA